MRGYTASMLVCLCFLAVSFSPGSSHHEQEGFPTGRSPATLVKKDGRQQILSTENGEISEVQVSDGRKGVVHQLQFITLEPNALFLPVQLHADMVFYVHSGAGRLSWTDEDELRHLDLHRGDVYSLRTGTSFFIQSNLENECQKLQIYAIFAKSQEYSQEQPSIGAYSSLHDMLIAFDKKVLQAAFNVPEDMIEELRHGARQPLIVHGLPEAKKTMWEVKARMLKTLIRSNSNGMFDVNKHKTKLFNILTADRDIENCNGWSLSVTRKKYKVLKHSDIGIFMVNLTRGAMMGPHWNPMTTEIAIVLQGRGMVRVVCSSMANDTGCKDTRFRVEEGDVFAVPRFHPMTQISFNNDSFVFMGFTTTSKNNHPQFLVGKASVFQALDRSVLAATFNVNETTIDQLLTPQKESMMLACTSCAEEEEILMEQEIRREEEARRRKEEEARKREEEEARKREEEEARKREEEEEKARKREEEEARKREEEEARKREEEEARKREEEETRKREEEEARKREEEEARKREEEEARKREEEEARKREEEEARRREEEEARKREEEEARKREEEEARRREEEEARKREEEEARRREEEEARKREEEEARKREEEEARKREGEEEEARRREEEEAKKREEEEEEARRREEEEQARKEIEEARKREEEEARREEEEARKSEEEIWEREKEEEEARKKEEERREEEARKEEEEARKREEEEQESEAAEARKREEEEQESEAAEARKREEKAAQEEDEARKSEEKEPATAARKEEEDVRGREYEGGREEEARKGGESRDKEVESRRIEEEAAKKEEEKGEGKVHEKARTAE